MRRIEKTIAALIAVSMLLSLTACGGKDKTNSKTDTTTAAETTAASEETPQTESAETETAKTVGTYADGTFDCEYYSVTVDEKKWGYTEGSEMDCLFNYIEKPDDTIYSASSLNVASFSEETMGGLTVSDYAEQMLSTYKDIEGYEVSQKDSELDGQKGVEITINFPMGESRMTIKQLIVSKNGAVVAVSYGAMDDIYEKMQKQFDEVIGGIKLK